MANLGGAKFNKGGKMARKKGISIDFSGFAELAERLDELGADIKGVLTDVMEQNAEDVQQDTLDALTAPNLPRHGAYSTGDTAEGVEKFPKVVWEGPYGEIGLGFDKTKKGAGGWLITGTPKMRPDAELARIYTGKSYERKLKDSIYEDLQQAVADALGG